MSGYQPYQQFRWIPGPLVRKIRTTSLLTGTGTVLLSLVMGISAIVLGGTLPISDHPMTGLSTAMVGLAAFFTLCSGIVMMGGPTYAKVDRLNVFVAVRARRGMVVFWVSVIVLGALASLNLFFIAGAPRYEGEVVTAPILSYTLLPVALIVLSGIDVFVGRSLFRPSDKLLRRYSWSQ